MTVRLWTISAVIGLFGLTAAFMNCSPNRGFNSLGIGSVANQTGTSTGTEVPDNHPPVEPLTDTEEVSLKPLLMSRFQIASHLRAIFDGPALSTEARTYLNGVVNEEAMARGNLFGGACDFADPLDGATTEADCFKEGADPIADMHYYPMINREASHMQLCMRLTASDELIANLRTRVQTEAGSLAADPSAESVRSLYQLFFIGQEPSPEMTQKLLELDTLMRNQLENLNDRWRMLILSVCESPDWQRL